MEISQQGIDLLIEREGKRHQAYRDSVGVWTIGVGHTGPEVHEGLTITEEQADAYLADDLARFERCVSEALTVEPAQAQFDACVSLAFNIGCGNFNRSSVLRYTNEGEPEKAREAFALWNRANKKVMAGLTRRRAAEAELFGSE